MTPVAQMREAKRRAHDAREIERIASWQATQGHAFARRPRAGFATWLLMSLTRRQK